MANVDISSEDHTRISSAIQKMERKTSGEIYAVVAHQSDDYFFNFLFQLL